MAERKDKRRGPAKTGTATIYDVARLAGVSTATVSRANSNPDKVSRRTREIIAAAAREVAYLPNPSARAGRARPSGMVLAVIPRMGSPFFTPFLDSVSDLLSEAGLCVAVSDVLGSAKKETNIARQIERGQFDGVILFTGRLPAAIDLDRLGGRVPLVLVCNEIPGLAGVPVFDVANREAARQLVAYLISIGHRRIAHIRGPERNVEANERLAGYREALAAAGLPAEDDLIWPGDFYLGSGIAAAGRFLARAERPSAVFVGNDQMAMGFITELKHAGISVPGDVSVAGFDDLEYSVIFDPPLTTMHQPRAELGRLAAIELLQRLRGAKIDAPPARVRLGCELVIRSSTQHIRQSGAAASPQSPKRRKAGSRPADRVQSVPNL